MIKKWIEEYHRYLEVHRMHASHFWFIFICFIILFILVGLSIASGH